VVQNGGMEVTQVKGGTKPCLGVGAQPQELALADQVPKRLPGCGDVAVDLGGYERLGSGVWASANPNARAGSSRGRAAGIDHQPHSPPGRVAQHAERRP
jgi:hypothetical protein